MLLSSVTVSLWPSVGVEAFSSRLPSPCLVSRGPKTASASFAAEGMAAFTVMASVTATLLCLVPDVRPFLFAGVSFAESEVVALAFLFSVDTVASLTRPSFVAPFAVSVAAVGTGFVVVAVSEAVVTALSVGVVSFFASVAFGAVMDVSFSSCAYVFLAGMA